jgi:prepilin-type N-terminal cleavage/methylation domain-containing protein
VEVLQVSHTSDRPFIREFTEEMRAVSNKLMSAASGFSVATKIARSRLLNRTLQCSGFCHILSLIPKGRNCMSFAEMLAVMKLSSKTHSTQSAFTLVELMIVVGIISLLAAIAVPNFLRARKRSQATRILEDLRVIDSAIDQYAIENNKVTGAAVNWTDIRNYLKTGSSLYNSGGSDILGDIYVGYSVDTLPKLRSASYSKLSDVAPLSFWSPYYP